MIEFEASGHLYAFIASLSAALFMLFKQINRVQAGKSTWKKWKKNQWDDVAAALIFPQFLSFFYEGGYSIYVWAVKGDWDFFFDTFEGVNIIFGLFGVLIYTKLMKKGKDKIESL